MWKAKQRKGTRWSEWANFWRFGGFVLGIVILLFLLQESKRLREFTSLKTFASKLVQGLVDQGGETVAQLVYSRFSVAFHTDPVVMTLGLGVYFAFHNTRVKHVSICAEILI